MKELTIDEIVFLWSAMWKYDHKLHGWKIEDEVTAEKAEEKAKELKDLYGDLL